VVRLCCTLAALISFSVVSAYSAHAATYSKLALKNGWTNSPFSTRKRRREDNRRTRAPGGGDRKTGRARSPSRCRPPFGRRRNVFVPVDLCNATNGRLIIEPTGVTVDPEGAFSDAQCFTSLEGVVFGR
jgi:hypothetical protein